MAVKLNLTIPVESAREPQAQVPIRQKTNRIFESYKMGELLDHIAPDQKTKYVLLDIDNTLTAPLDQEIGSAQWRKYIKEKATEEGYTPDEAEELLDQLWYYVMPQIRVRLIDEQARLILQLQPSIPVLGFTAREYKEVTHTEKQLESIDFSFANTHFEKEIELPLPHRGLYKNGIIYCGENTKGQTLLAFFVATGKIPEEIDVVDDKREQLTNAQKAAQEKDISFVGMHFRAEDQRVASFNGAIADLQLEMLPKLISDEEARSILASNPRPRLKLRDFLKRLGK